MPSNDAEIVNLLSDNMLIMTGFPLFEKVLELFRETTGRKWDDKLLTLEIGAGSGKFSLHSALYYETQSVITDVDPSVVATEIIHAKLVESIVTSTATHAGTRLSVIIKQADVMNLPWHDNTFDVVWNEGTPEHWARDDPKRMKCLTEMVRVSRDAVLIITNDADELRSAKKGAETKHTYMTMPEKETQYTQLELLANLQKAGLKNVRVDRYNHKHEAQGYLLAIGFKASL